MSYLGLILAVIFLGLPIIMLFLAVKPNLIIETLTDPIVTSALYISLKSTLITLLLVLIIGVPASYCLAKKKVILKEIIDTIIDLPIVLPPAVAGLALLITLGPKGIVGKWLIALDFNISFTIISVVLAQLFVALPLFIKTVRTAFESIDSLFIHASLTLGKSPRITFLKIILPLAMPAIIRGGLMSWARALGEFGATIMFAGNMPGVTQTLPLAVYTLLERDVQTSIIISVVLILTSIFVMISVKYLTLRSYN